MNTKRPDAPVPHSEFWSALRDAEREADRVARASVMESFQDWATENESAAYRIASGTSTITLFARPGPPPDLLLVANAGVEPVQPDRPRFEHYRFEDADGAAWVFAFDRARRILRLPEPPERLPMGATLTIAGCTGALSLSPNAEGDIECAVSISREHLLLLAGFQAPKAELSLRVNQDADSGPDARSPRSP